MTSKSPFNLSLFICVILCISLQPSLQFIFTGREVIDLNSTTSAAFIQDTTYWTSNSLVSSPTKYSPCGTTYLLGGYNVLGTGRNNYFQRIYPGLNTHNMIRYSLTVFFIDTWDSGSYDGFLLGFDSQLIDAFHMGQGSFTTKVCGLDNNDLPYVRVFGLVTHAAVSLYLKIFSYFDEPSNNESVGVRDIYLMFDQGPPMTQTMCARAPITLPYKTCSCKEGQYYGASGCADCDPSCDSCYAGTSTDCYACKRPGYGFDGYQCVACAIGCDTCSGPGANQCYSCTSDFTYFPAGNMCLTSIPYPLTTATDVYGTTALSPCTSGTYVYWDKTCASTCPAPLTSTTILNSVMLCIFPCSPNDYIYWDGACHSTCPSPLTTTITKNAKLCQYTCTTAQYLNADKSCTASCASPMYATIVNNRNLCISPCTIPGDYLYWDQSCLNTCPSPLGSPTVSGVLQCTYPCTSVQYLAWNSSCLTSCPFPLIVRTDKGQQFCDYPTNTAQFLYWDGTTSATCNTPLSQRTEGTPVRKFCDFKCQNSEYLYANGTCSINCLPPLKKRFQNGRQFCDNSCSSGYLYWNSSCLTTCTSPLVPRLEGSNQLCDFPKGNVSNFLYWDSTFSSVCPAPLVQKIEGTTVIRKFCTYPCTNTQYLNWDGTCVTACDPSLTSRIQNGRNFCNFPCGSGFKLFDGTCVSICDPPLVQVTQGGGKLCNHPCSTTTYFYYWDGSCQATCPLPYQQQTIASVQWCINPCLAHQYLYSNGTCLESCDSPFSPTETNNVKYCVNACPSSQYLFWNGTCLSACPYPLLAETADMGVLCNLPCDNVEMFYHQSTGLCSYECASSSIVDNGFYLSCLTEIEPDTSSVLDLVRGAPAGTEMTFVSLVPILKYIKFTNITFTPRLQQLAASRGRNPLSLRFGPKMSASTQALFTEYNLPLIFKQYGLPSSFVVNFWSEAMMWLILFFIGVFFRLVAKLCEKKDWRRGRAVFTKLETLFRWNYLLIMIATSTPDIVLYSAVQWKTIHPNSSFSTLSSQFGLVLMTLIGVLLCGVAYLVGQWQEVHKHEGDVFDIQQRRFLEKWNKCQILFKGYSLKSRLASSFYLIYLIRFFAPMFIGAFGYSAPLLQVMLYLVISIAILVYILVKKPLENTINFVQLVILEFLILIVNLSLVGLVILTSTGRLNTTLAILLGDVVIVGNSMISIVFIIFLFIKLIQGAKLIHESLKGQPKKDRSAWLQLIVYLMQQGGMGFEEIDVNANANADEYDSEASPLKKEKDHQEKTYDNDKPNSQRELEEKDEFSVDKKPNIRAAAVSKAFSFVREKNASGASDIARKEEKDPKWAW